MGSQRDGHDLVTEQLQGNELPAESTRPLQVPLPDRGLCSLKKKKKEEAGKTCFMTLFLKSISTLIIVTCLAIFLKSTQGFIK